MDYNAKEWSEERIKYFSYNTDFASTIFKNLTGYGIIFTDLDGKIIAYNEGARIIYGYMPEEVIGKRYFENLFSDEFGEYSGLNQIILDLLEAENISIEREQRRENGEIFSANISFSLAKDKNNKYYGILIIVNDLSEIKKMQNHLFELNDCFVNFGPDSVQNINDLTALCGELLKSDSSFYVRLDGGELVAVGQWNVPPDFEPVDNSEGHISKDVIISDDIQPYILHNLSQSPYAQSDPNVLRYNLQTYIGHPVQFNGKNIGSLCVVYKSDFYPNDDDLRILGILASAIGVEEARDQSEKSRQSTEEGFQKVIDKNADAIIIISKKKGLMRFVNPAAEALFGRKSEELVGETFGFPTIAGETTKLDIVSRGGDKRTAEMRVVEIEWMGEPSLLASLRDITERELAEEELRKKDTALAALAVTTSRLLVEMDLSSAINQMILFLGLTTEADRVNIFENHDSEEGDHLMNQRYEWHLSEEPLASDDYPMENIPYYPAFSRWYETLASGSSIKGLVREFPKSERELLETRGVISTLVVPVIIQNHFWGFIGFEDCHLERDWNPSDYSILRTAAAAIGGAISRANMEKELKSYSEHLEELVKERTERLKVAERLATIGEVATMIGHDMRNPLQVIVNNLYLAKRKISNLSPAEVEIIEKHGFMKIHGSIEEQSKYLNKIISDLQDYARPIKSEDVDTELLQFFRNVLSSITIPENVELDLNIEENFIIHIDPHLMMRAFSNLITNGVQAMPDGGQLAISASQGGETVSIAVQDTGVGIPEETIDRLFLPLFTTKAKGTGLGLAVVKRLVVAHNGDIKVESKVGKGSTFTVMLPRKREFALKEL